MQKWSSIFEKLALVLQCAAVFSSLYALIRSLRRYRKNRRSRCVAHTADSLYEFSEMFH